MTLNAPKHNKHTALVRPPYGNFGRNEWAFVGAPCASIKMLAEQVINALSPAVEIAYVDAQHTDESENPSANLTPKAALTYTLQQGATQLNYNNTFNQFENRPLFNSCDLVLINGNHHQGKKQVVVIDSSKQASLLKRVDQLTDVGLFLLADGENEPFDFVKAVVPNWNEIPVYRINETDLLIQFFRDQVTEPELYGLVLAGGKSQRMGEDKGAINWHGKDQRYYMADLLKKFTSRIYISCRADQQSEIDPEYQTLPDTFTGLGPFGAILSAFREHPEKAWLVVACDLPLLNIPTLKFLTARRNTLKIATAFENTKSHFPEPLITIWEPKSYPVLLSFLSQGYSCPRKVLINSNTAILQAPDTDALTNVNTPEELERVRAILQQKTVIA